MDSAVIKEEEVNKKVRNILLNRNSPAERSASSLFVHNHIHRVGLLATHCVFKGKPETNYNSK
jgi:hypothetical protein